MRFTTAQFLNKEAITISVRNNNSANAILDGQPVVFDGVAGATYLGVDVKHFSEAIFRTMVAGILKLNNKANLAKGLVAEAIVYGFTDAIVTRRTRAATTDTWASHAAITAGDVLIPETVGNNLGVGASTDPLRFIAAESKATQTTAASTHFAGQLADTARMKVFVRALL